MDWSKVANPMAFEAFREGPKLAEREAEIAKAEAAKSLGGALTEDPFARERLQGELEAQRLSLPTLLKGRIDQMTERERRESYTAATKQIEDDFDAAIRKAVAENDKAAFDNAKLARERSIETLNRAYGIGARLSSNAFYGNNGMDLGMDFGIGGPS
jgi:hypothetical protein